MRSLKNNRGSGRGAPAAWLLAMFAAAWRAARVLLRRRLVRTNSKRSVSALSLDVDGVARLELNTGEIVTLTNEVETARVVRLFQKSGVLPYSLDAGVRYVQPAATASCSQRG